MDLESYITLQTTPNDEKEVKKLVDMTTKVIGTDEFTLCVDNGYWKPELLKKIYEGNTRVVIPDQADATRKKQRLKNKNKSGKTQEINSMKNQNNKKEKNKPKKIKKY